MSMHSVSITIVEIVSYYCDPTYAYGEIGADSDPQIRKLAANRAEAHEEGSSSTETRVEST